MKNLHPEELNKPRKRRLRKKLRVGKFQEFGFELKFIINQNLGVTFDSALDELILWNLRDGHLEGVEISMGKKSMDLWQIIVEAH